MEINRVIQLEILKYLASYYPNRAPDDVWKKLLELSENNEQMLISNLYYLYEQGCIYDKCLMRTLGTDGPRFASGLIQITHVGLDILQGDGGLSAIRNTVTIRFHEDALNFLEKCVLQGTGTPEKKRTLLEKLRNLPAVAIEHLMKKALDEVVLHFEDGYELIESLLDQL